MYIVDDDFLDAARFRRFLPEVYSRYEVGPADDPEIWTIRAYAIRRATNSPVGLFLHVVADRQKWSQPQSEDSHQGDRDRLGHKATAAMLTRDELIAEMKNHVGEWLPGSHEVLSVGIEHKERGLMAWMKLSDDELEAHVSALRNGEEGEPRVFMSPQEAAEHFGMSLLEAVKREGSPMK